MPPPNFKSVSIPDPAYEGLQNLRSALQQRGTASIPQELLDPPTCPSCGGAVEHVTVGVQHIKCGGCGYAQQTVVVQGNAFAPFATGALIGAAAAALFFYMNREEPQPRRRLPAKKDARKAAKKAAVRRAR